VIRIGPPRGRREAWEAVAGRMGGAFSESRFTGNCVVTAPYASWTLTMALQLSPGGFARSLDTRVHATFRGRGELQLSVRPGTRFDAFQRKLGLGGYLPADSSIAGTHVVTGRPALRVRAVLAAGLAAAVAERGAFRVEVRPYAAWMKRLRGDETRVVEVFAPGTQTDVEHMVAMFDVARRALDALTATGVAWPERD